ERAHVIRIDLERSLRPLHGARVLTVREERPRAERQCASIERIQLEDALGATDALSPGCPRLLITSEYAQRLLEEHRALKVFLANLRRLAEELGRALDVTAREAGSREIVV